MPVGQALTETEATEDEPDKERVLPTSYINAMAVAMSLSDVSITTYIDDVPQHRLHMSMTAAKTLATQLQQMIANFEEAVGVKVLTMDETRRVLNNLLSTGEEEREE